MRAFQLLLEKISGGIGGLDSCRQRSRVWGLVLGSDDTLGDEAEF
jgi:hypothetical protein